MLEQIKALQDLELLDLSASEPENLMFAYFEYHGTDHDADMATMAADPGTQEWWAVCMPMQSPLDTRKEGEWWAGMEEVFHID